MNASRRIIKNSLMMYAIMFLSIVVSIYSSRVVLATLGVEDFGIYSLIGGLVILFTFLNRSMSGSVQRFISAALGENNIEEAIELFNVAIVVHIFIALFMVAVGKVLGEWALTSKLTIPELRMNAAYWVFNAVLVAFICQVISAPAQAILISYERMAALSFITFINPLGRLISIILASTVGGDKLITFAFLTALFSFFQLILYYSYAKWKCKTCRFTVSRDKRKYSSLTSFAGWGLFGDLAAVGRTQGTAILLNLFFGPVANASFGISNQLTMNFKNISTMVTRAANPQIIKSYTSGDKTQAIKLVTQLSKVSFSILFIMSLPFLLQTEWILTLWLKEFPQYAPSFTRWAIVIALIEISSIPLMTLSKATGKIKCYQTVVGGILLLCLPASYFGLKNGMPPETVFLTIGITAIIALIARLAILRKTSGMQVMPFLRETLVKSSIMAALITALSVVLPHYLPEQQISMKIYHVIFIPLITAAMAYQVILTKTERTFIRKLCRIKSK